MERVASNFNFSNIEKIMQFMEVNHSDSDLNKLKNELNKFFIKSKCMQILYTLNTDKLFFGMRVYPIIDSNTASDILVEAINNSVKNAESIGGFISYKDIKELQ